MHKIIKLPEYQASLLITYVITIYRLTEHGYIELTIEPMFIDDLIKVLRQNKQAIKTEKIEEYQIKIKKGCMVNLKKFDNIQQGSALSILRDDWIELLKAAKEIYNQLKGQGV